MSSYNVILSRSTIKSLKKIDARYINKIKIFLKQLENGPYVADFDIKKMVGEDYMYRCRIGIYRVVYIVKNSEVTIVVLDIDHRKDIYRQM